MCYYMKKCALNDCRKMHLSASNITFIYVTVNKKMKNLERMCALLRNIPILPIIILVKQA